MKYSYRLLIPISGIALLLGIVIGVIWIGTEIQSIHETNRVNHNDWISEEKETVSNLHHYLLTGDSTYYREYRKDFNMLQKRVEWGNLIIDPSVDRERIVGILSEKTSQSRWQIKKSIFVNRNLQYFEPVRQTVQQSLKLTGTLGQLDSLGIRVASALADPPVSQAQRTELSGQLRQLKLRIEELGYELNQQHAKTSAWMQDLIVNGTIVLAAFLLLISIGVILAMNRKQQKSERRLFQRSKQLRLSKEKFRKLFDNSPLSIAYLDENKRIVQINDSFKCLFGYSLQEIENRRPDQFITPADKQEEGHSIEQQALRGEPVTIKSVRTDKQGNRIHVILTTVPIEYQQELTGFFAIFTDITEQIDNQKQLQETIQDREVLIQEIHHRVKNNLAIISGLLFMQSEKSGDPKTIAHLQDALNRIQSMALVHEQLYRQTESDAHINMDDYLPNLTKSIRDTSGTSQENVQINVEAENITLPLTKAVPIGLLTTELLMNAYKHAFNEYSEGYINVTLSKSNRQFKLDVTDNGFGLPADFSLQSDSLGINIINNLVEQIEGEINYESTPDRGTHFSITF
jgi:PAS domain S-box-containing protein